MASSVALRSSKTFCNLQTVRETTNSFCEGSPCLQHSIRGKRVGQKNVQRLKLLGCGNATSRTVCTAWEGSRSLAGEPFGARDPFDAEVESNFGDKVLGNADTEHKIKVPILRGIVGLSARSCQKLEPDAKALSAEEANDLKKQILGWKIFEGENGELRLRREWTLRNFRSGLELFQRIGKLAAEQGHHPDLHLTGWNTASVELYTHTLGGLSENDFILAAKIEEINITDLIKKIKRFWA